MTRYRWILVSILLLTMATGVALTRQQMNFEEHKKIVDVACHLVDENRRVIRSVLFTLSETESISLETRQVLKREARKIRHIHQYCHGEQP